MKPIGFTSLLGLMFIGLKLHGSITWSWPWVVSPFIANFIYFSIERALKKHNPRYDWNEEKGAYVLKPEGKASE